MARHAHDLMSPLKLMSWNIQEGGDDRLDAIAVVMRANKPDRVALLEADSLSDAEALASELGMTLTYGAANCLSAVAWLTAQTPVDAENHRLPQLAKTLLETNWSGTAHRCDCLQPTSDHAGTSSNPWTRSSPFSRCWTSGEATAMPSTET